MRAPARLLVPIPAARLPRPAAPPLQVLCECLVYAACIQQRVAPADIADLADLLHRLSLRARGGGGGDLAAQQQAYVVLLAALLTLLPLENAEGADAEADEHALRSVAASPELDAKLGGSAADDPHGAVLKLAWGVLLSQYGPESAAGRGGGGWVPASWLGGVAQRAGCPAVPARPTAHLTQPSRSLSCARPQTAPPKWCRRPRTRARWASYAPACWTAWRWRTWRTISGSCTRVSSTSF